MKKSATQRAVLRFGLRVFEERTARGLTQEQLAELLGEEVQQVKRIERGDANIALHAIFALSAALDVEPSALFLAPSKATIRRPGRPPKQSE